MAHDVFISYATPDKTTADAVCARLEHNGIRCWIAPRDIVPGSSWKPSIVGAIKAARVLVLIFSAHANDSTEVPKEVDQAVKNGLSIVTFRIENVPPISGLDYELHGRHWLDALTPPLDRHIDQLTATLSAVLERPVAAPPGAPPPARGRRLSGAVIASVGVLALAVAGGAGWFVARRAGPNPAANSVEQAPAPPPAATTSGAASEPSGGAGTPAALPLPPASKLDPRPARASRASASPSTTAARPASSEPPLPVAARPSEQPPVGAGAPQVATDEPRGLTGCWSYKTFLPLLITVTPDGRVSGFLEGGHWTGSGGQYVITWPRSVDTLTLSPDGRTLAGTNNYAGPIVSARRASGSASLVGTWQGSNGQPTIFRDDGVVTNGPVPGRWTRLSDSTIRIVWEFAFVDQLTLSPDGRSIEGRNQLGLNLSGVRVSCGA